MGQINLVGALGGLNFEKIVEGEVEIAQGTTEVDLSAGASFAGLLDDFDIIVVQLTGSLTNQSSKNRDYMGVGGIQGDLSTIYVCDFAPAAEGTATLEKETFWFHRLNARKWRKEYRLYNSTNHIGYKVGETANPMRLLIEEGYLSGTVSYVVYGCRFAMLDAATSGNSGGLEDGEEIETPPDVDVDGEAGLL